MVLRFQVHLFSLLKKTQIVSEMITAQFQTICPFFSCTELPSSTALMETSAQETEVRCGSAKSNFCKPDSQICRKWWRRTTNHPMSAAPGAHTTSSQELTPVRPWWTSVRTLLQPVRKRIIIKNYQDSYQADCHSKDVKNFPIQWGSAKHTHTIFGKPFTENHARMTQPKYSWNWQPCPTKEHPGKHQTSWKVRDNGYWLLSPQVLKVT